MIDTIIFDMDGLMFDTEHLSNKIWCKLFSDLNLVPNQTFFDSIKGTDENTCNLLFNKYYHNCKYTFEELKNKKSFILHMQIEKNGIPIKKGLFELLDYLIKNNYKYVMATSSPRKVAEFYLKKANIFNLFPNIISGDDVKKSKPDPTIFLKAINLVISTIKSSLVLEDSKNGVMAAVNGKIKCIWIKDTINFNPPKEVIKKDNLLQVIDYLSTQLD